MSTVKFRHEHNRSYVLKGKKYLVRESILNLINNILLIYNLLVI